MSMTDLSQPQMGTGPGAGEDEVDGEEEGQYRGDLVHEHQWAADGAVFEKFAIVSGPVVGHLGQLGNEHHGDDVAFHDVLEESRSLDVLVDLEGSYRSN